jgi:hypothetical protein
MIVNIDFSFPNFSSNVGPISPLSSIWNNTDPSQETFTLYPHPILYGVAIYALLLIIVGTIG